MFLETSAVRFTAWLLPNVPRGIILSCARIIGLAAYALDGRGRRTALENLRVAFAREHITPEQARRITRESYQTFARTFLDLFWSARLNRENFREFFHIRFEDEGVDALARERGSIWVTPHFGNFELVSHIWGFRGFPFAVVAQDFKNPALTAIFKRLRGGSGHTVIPQAGAMLRLVKTLSQHGHAAMLSDLNIKPNRMAAALRCFGLLTCATTLHACLSQRLGVPVMAVVCAQLPDGTHQASVSRAFEPSQFATPAAMSQAVWDWFEAKIRETPEAWLWMYKHWRYLPTPAQDPSYPDYANYWKEFRKLVDATAPGGAAGA
jgi:lauroyl/myristoyl acyltransferase